MEFKLKMDVKNSFPKEGIFIKSKWISVWLEEIQNMGLSLEAIKVFPVPSTVANELYGCIIFFNSNVVYLKDIGKNNFYQLIENKLFIPLNTTVFPELAKEEWNTLFSEKYHFLHPEIGFVALEDEVIWSDLVRRSNQITVAVVEPSNSVTIPKFISSLRIEVDKEELLKEIENPFSEQEVIEKLPFNLKKLMNGNNREMDKFLAYLEKNPEMAIRMAVPLDTIGSARGGYSGIFSFNSGFRRLFNFSWISRFFDIFSAGKQSAFEFFKYAFILIFILLLRNCTVSEFKENLPGLIVFACIVVFVIVMISFLSRGNSGYSNSSGGSFLIDSSRFNTLQNRYTKLADDFVSRKEYEKAAHIYLKLLKNNHKAATVLENGKLYRKAAAIYLKYLQNKTKAAECYEKGHAYNEAILLYKEINDHEKVGDLYLILKNKKEADKNYYKVIEDYKVKFQYIKAALIYKKKIKNVSDAQELLLEGWRTNKDASNCLNNYFTNINLEELPFFITDIYNNELNASNKEKFLEVLKLEYDKDKRLEDLTRNIAYEIVAERIDKRPELASQLIGFNKSNRSMTKDIMKFKLNKRK